MHSSSDISSVLSLSNRSLLNCVVHSGGISLIAKTESAKQSKVPLWTKLKTDREITSIFNSKSDHDDEDKDAMNWLRVVNYLEEKGFAYYFWKPEAPGITKLMSDKSKIVQDFHSFAQHYDLESTGVKLRKVDEDALSQGIQMQRLSDTLSMVDALKGN